jgi:hypothetical protein
VPFLTAALEHADSIDALDDRFTLGQPTGSSLWSLPTNLQYVLAQRGVSVAELAAPSAGARWRELIATAIR